ncbi:MAG: ABC transporter permease [Vulcanibacillus sp.]
MNKKLILGIIAVILFIIISFFGGLIAPYSIDYIQITTYKDGVITAPPSPPSNEHLLGTDIYGKDILSILLYGAKYTVLTAIIISFIRVLLGSLIGIFLGIKTLKKKKTIISSALFGIIPSFLIIYFLLFSFNIQIESTEIKFEVMLVTISIFVLVGLPGIISTIREKTEGIMKKEFISSSITLGANTPRLMFKHIYPQILETLVILFTTEIVLVLVVYGQLGLFDFFIGGTVMYFDPITYNSITWEWAGLIGQARMYIYSKKWIVLSPIFAYILLVLSFQLLASGLNEYFKRKLHNYPYI